LHLLILDAAGGLAIKKRNGSGHWGKFEKRLKTVSGAGISRNPSGCKTEMRPILQVDGKWVRRDAEHGTRDAGARQDPK
jgi:hypothetical protein